MPHVFCHTYTYHLHYKDTVMHLFRDRYLNKNVPSGIISQGEAKNNENVRVRGFYAVACGERKRFMQRTRGVGE